MSAIPVDLEIAVNRWALAERLDEIVREIEATPLSGAAAAIDACWLLGQVIGRLDFLIGELNATEVEL